MLLCIFLPVFSFLLYSQGSFAQSSPHYEAIQRLHAELLKNYNKQTIPQTERAKPLDITTGFTLETFDFVRKLTLSLPPLGLNATKSLLSE